MECETIVTRNRLSGSTGRTGRSYVENQAILEPILLYRASKCKQTKEQGSEDRLWAHIFTFYKIVVSFFSFLCLDANKTRSNCAIGCNLSKKHKLTQCKTEWRVKLRRS